MLTNLQVLILALVQGLTEFLPVSSSAHLILVPKVFGWFDQGLTFDVAVHLGTLLAVLLYFRAELARMTSDFIGWVFGRAGTQYSNLALQLVIATLPVCFIGWVFHDQIERWVRSPLIIGIFTIIFAFFLGWSDRQGPAPRKNLTEMTWIQAFKIGLCQMLALIPGVSRSGITLTAGLGLGFARDEAARFSFLLSIPVILAAVGLEGWKVSHAATSIHYTPLLLGMGISAICAYFCIHFFLKLVNRWGMFPFVIYRLMLGSFLLAYFYL